MSWVTAEDLRDSSPSLLERVEAGETLIVTVEGRPVARLTPIGRHRWMPKHEFAALFDAEPADPSLASERRALERGTAGEDRKS